MALVESMWLENHTDLNLDYESIILTLFQLFTPLIN